MKTQLKIVFQTDRCKTRDDFKSHFIHYNLIHLWQTKREWHRYALHRLKTNFYFLSRGWYSHEDRWQQGFINDCHFYVLTIALFGKENKKIQSEYLCHNSVYLKNLGFRIATPVSFFFFFFHLGDVECGNGSWPVVGKIVGCEIFDLLFHWFLSFIGMWLKTYFPCITVTICVSWKFRLEFGVHDFTSVLISPNLSYNGSSVVLTLTRLLLSRLLLIITIYESSWMEIWG